MKKILKYAIAIVSLSISNLSFASACYVSVVSPTNSPISNVSVQGIKSDDSTTTIVTTNEAGKVVVRWNDTEPLKSIYIDGQEKNGCEPFKGVVLIKIEVSEG